MISMEKVKELASQRRVWVAVLSVLCMVLSMLGHVEQAGMIMVLCTNAGLSLWSYSKPKK